MTPKGICIFLLLVGGASLSYLYFKQPLYHEYKDYRTLSCYGHVQLCWLRSIITNKFDVILPKELYNMTTLHHFKRLALVAGQNHHKPHCMDSAKRVLHLLRGENVLGGSKGLIPKPQFQGNNSDIYGRNSSYNPFTEYKYRFSACYDGTSVKIYVTETLKTSNTDHPRGNNIFGVVRTARTVSSCRLVEYNEDRIYTFHCPILEDKFRIDIIATYITITKTILLSPRKVLKLKHFTNDLFQRTNGADLLTNSVKLTCKDSRMHEAGFWVKINSYFHWSTTICHYPFSFKLSQVLCLREKSILMLGDSHNIMRISAIKASYNMPKMTDYNINHALPMWCNLTEIYHGILNGTTQVDVLVANAGAHDIGFINILLYIATMRDIIDLFQAFSRLRVPPQIIWIETTPIGNNGFHRGMATNQMMEACNDWISHHMEKVGVQVIHAFDVAIPMSSKHRGDGQHYYHDLGKNARYKDTNKVNVGGAITSILVHAICPVVCPHVHKKNQNP